MARSVVLRTTAAGGAVVGALLLAGCGSGGGAAPAAAVVAQPASATPPDKAAMVCSAEIRSRITASLHLASDPTADTTWADSLFTCTYHLPDGPLPVSVKVLGSDAAARSYLETQRAMLTGAREAGGFGDQAYETDGGVVIAVKDAFVLRVDATKLPGTLGVAPTQETPSDLATVVARGIFSCWTEEDH